ncbi:MAG: hypothetical protein IPJ78_01535 [Gemmatimonadetes bacterium]|jgi:hypothetical protein|nr:hypothetical protein [Gemmatimonadota bacterium]MBP7549064.1 hypothetical protein [Gemmatimonadaceae bacterium]
MSDAPKRAREGLVVRKFRLGEEPPDDILSTTTADERLAMVWELTRRIWELQGSLPCPYTRDTIPIRVLRRDER